MESCATKTMQTTSPSALPSLQTAFPGRVQLDVPLARYTAALVGGPADALLEVKSAEELATAVDILWAEGLPFTLLGGGSNVLVSDAGVRGVVLLNRAKKVQFDLENATVWAESGANFGAIARQAATKSLSGLEWAAGIPGTVGGGVLGNAGAHDTDMAHSLIEAQILTRRTGQETWPVEKMQYVYRGSVLKADPGETVVLSALLQLVHGSPEAIQAKMDTFLTHRHRTQPPGASMGSMFKNPPQDYAGRLIDAAGLKGTRVGGAQISPLHGNFFTNTGQAAACDVYQLIQLARQTVAEKFGVHLALEIELIGEWMNEQR